MLSVKSTCSLLKGFFRPEVDVDSSQLVQTLDDKRVSQFIHTGQCCCVDFGPEVCNSIPEVFSVQ